MDHKLLQLCYLLIAATSVTPEGIGDFCTTPNNEPAKCVAIDDCKILLDAIRTSNATLIEFAKDSHCGFDANTPLVCCGTIGYPQPLVVTQKPQTSSRKTPNLQFISSDALPDRTTCGIERETPRLTGATAAGIDEFPWMALISYRDEGGNDIGFRCGGTLINNKHVLTAAHCILTAPETFKAYFVRLGEWNLAEKTDCIVNIAIRTCSDPVVDIKIVEEMAHPYYNWKTGNNDIGILRLERNVKYSDYIRPICLPPINLPAPTPGSLMTVCGWGATENSELSSIKLKLIVPLVSNVDCAKVISNTTAITANQVCAGGEEGKDACHGDSGGPLMRTYTDDTSQWYQEGVVSRGRGCGRKGFPGVYTRVTRYTAWITNYLSEGSE